MSANPALASPAFIRPAGVALDSPVGTAINGLYLAEERECIAGLLPLAKLDPEARAQVQELAIELIDAVRRNRTRKGGLDAFLKQYDLASREGVILMCLAEALLRIPDAETADRLIADKIAAGNWSEHLGDSDSLFVNASTWGLMLTGRLFRPEADELANPAAVIARMATRLGEPVVRAALKQAMRIMGHQFVMGRTMQEALERAREGDNRLYRYSFDMLGEAAMTAEDAVRYSAAYSQAIATAGADRDASMSDEEAPSISVKLSALFPRYEYAQRERVLAELGPRLLQLVVEARSARIALTIDAEESERLELSLELIDRVLQASVSAGWGGFGVAVQAYQKRAPDVLRWLISRARVTRRRLNIRLVKGAYWDSEIKRAQERGLSGYPVFTRKINTDVSYLACVRLLLEGGEFVYPQFATHNAHTVASVILMARGHESLIRVSAPARHGRGALCRDRRCRQTEYSVPSLCTGRSTRGPLALSRASAAGEWGQHFFRKSHRRRSAAGDTDCCRPDSTRRRAEIPCAPTHCSAA